MKYKKILWRLTIFPLILILIPIILFLLSVLRMDDGWWDTRKSLIYLVDIGWNGIYNE